MTNLSEILILSLILNFMKLSHLDCDKIALNELDENITSTQMVIKVRKRISQGTRVFFIIARFREWVYKIESSWLFVSCHKWVRSTTLTMHNGLKPSLKKILISKNASLIFLPKHLIQRILSKENKGCSNFTLWSIIVHLTSSLVRTKEQILLSILVSWFLLLWNDNLFWKCIGRRNRNAPSKMVSSYCD